MFCRNCKAEVADKAVICVACGMKPLDGNKFCNSCGHPTHPDAQVCVGCGIALKNVRTGERKWIVALLLAWFLGVFGVHRFYTGHTGLGIVQLLTLGGCGVWALIDFIFIAIGSYRDADGKALSRD